MRALLGRLGGALRLLGDLLVPPGEPRALGGLLARGAQLVPQVLALLAQLGDLGLEPLAGTACGALVLDERLKTLIEPRTLVGDSLQLRARDLKGEASLLELRLRALVASLELALELLDAPREPLVRRLEPAARRTPVGRRTAVVLHALARSGQFQLDAVALEDEARGPAGEHVDRERERGPPLSAVRRGGDPVARGVRKRLARGPRLRTS